MRACEPRMGNLVVLFVCAKLMSLQRRFIYFRSFSLPCSQWWLWAVNEDAFHSENGENTEFTTRTSHPNVFSAAFGWNLVRSYRVPVTANRFEYRIGKNRLGKDSNCRPIALRTIRIQFYRIRKGAKHFSVLTYVRSMAVHGTHVVWLSAMFACRGVRRRRTVLMKA